ncbi:MAG: toprim domain-containing protein [Adlercreutzia equolifaciens]
MRHIRVLAKHAPKKIVYLFDGDAAGQKAADRALAFIGESISDKNRNSVELLASPCRTTRIRPSSCRRRARRLWRRWWKGRSRSSSSASNGASTAST